MGGDQGWEVWRVRCWGKGVMGVVRVEWDGMTGRDRTGGCGE